MIDRVPLIDELKAALIDAQARLRTTEPHALLFQLRLELRTQPEPGGTHVGFAERTLEARVLPYVGDYLADVGPWGERPLVDRVRITRIEHSPSPRWNEHSPSVPSVTISATGYTYDRTGIEREFTDNGWVTSFAESVD